MCVCVYIDIKYKIYMYKQAYIYIYIYIFFFLAKYGSWTHLQWKLYPLLQLKNVKALKQFFTYETKNYN